MTESTVTVLAGTEAMVFSDADPITGQPLSAEARLQARMASSQWRNDAVTPGTAAYVERQRLVLDQAAEAGGQSMSAHQVAKELRDLGQSEEQIAELLVRLGFKPGEANTRQQQQPQEAAALTPPEAFRFDYSGGAPATAEDRAADMAMRVVASEAGFTPSEFTGIEKLANDVLNQQWTQETFDARAEQSEQRLREVYGADYDKNTALVWRYFDETLEGVQAKHPFAKDMQGLLEVLAIEPLIFNQLLLKAKQHYRIY